MNKPFYSLKSLINFIYILFNLKSDCNKQKTFRFVYLIIKKIISKYRVFFTFVKTFFYKMLENTDIKLRLPELSDLDFLYETENNTELWEKSNTIKPFSKYTLQKYIENSHIDIYTAKQVRFIIERKEDKHILGLIELFDYEPLHLRAGTGIYITKNEQQKGYAKQALEILIDYCKNILRLNQIYCNISFDNNESINLFEKSGFKYSGTKKLWLNTAEGFKDVLFYQLIF